DPVRLSISQQRETEKQDGPAHRDRGDGAQRTASDVANRRERDGGEYLTVEPAFRSAGGVLFQEIAGQCILLRTQTSQNRHREGGRLVHTRAPFSSGMPFHSAMKARCVLRTDLTPAAVT